MGRHETYVDGQVVEHNDLLDYRTYATYAEIVTATTGFGFNETGRVYLCLATGMFYYWNGAALVPFPSTGGAGAPSDRTYITTADESATLTGSVRHSTLTNAGGFLHECLLHHATHESGGTDEPDVTGLSGKLADPQNAGWLLTHIIDNISLGDQKFMYYDLASNSMKFVAIPGGGDMLKASYATASATKVDTALNSEKLNGQAAAFYATATEHATHATGGAAAFLIGDLLDGIARVQARVNSVAIAGFVLGARRQFNFLNGTNTTWTITEVPASEEITVRVDASALTGLLPYETTAQDLTNYVPVTAGANGQAVIVQSSHATDGGTMIYIYSGGAWNKVLW